MAHNHSVIDLDKHFIIDPISRQITTQADKIKIMQHDHNSEIFTFEIPKSIEGHDMSQCNRVEVHFLNMSKDSKRITPHNQQALSFSLHNISTSFLPNGDRLIYP